MTGVMDPTVVPEEKDLQIGSMWRLDKLKEMTYTQFWHLVQQRQIDRVRSQSRMQPPAAAPSLSQQRYAPTRHTSSQL